MMSVQNSSKWLELCLIERIDSGQALMICD